MSTINPKYDDFVICNLPGKPVQVTVGKLKSWIAQNDEASKKMIIDVIYHRLNRRYVKPLLNIPKEFKSGFLMMAVSCLLIETLQSFYEGLEDTDNVSNKAFKDFFERGKEFFPAFTECFPKSFTKDKKNNFYINIRCGILHQAETTGGYRILRDGSPLFDKDAQTINANKFVEALKRCIDKYINDLRACDSNTHLWKMAVKKLGHICDNCQR